MAKVFINRLMQELAPALNNNQPVKNLAYSIAQGIFQNKKNNLLKEFDEHSITQDLNDGPAGLGNRSNTLSSARGNLFSFIGFPEGTTPAKTLRLMIDEGIKLQEISSSRFDRKLFGYTFPVNIISLKEIYKNNPYPVSKNLGGPWAPGSWVQGIETYISGLHYYVSSIEDRIKAQRALAIAKMIQKSSRSGVAIQLSPQIRERFLSRPFMRFHPKPYLTPIFRRFYAQFRGPKGRFI